MSSNQDCDNGDKFVLKNKKKVNRRQFLFMDGRTILAFVPVGQKFTQCSSYTEVTALVDCKVTLCWQSFAEVITMCKFAGCDRSSGHNSSIIL